MRIKVSKYKTNAQYSSFISCRAYSNSRLQEKLKRSFKRCLGNWKFVKGGSRQRRGRDWKETIWDAGSLGCNYNLVPADERCYPAEVVWSKMFQCNSGNLVVSKKTVINFNFVVDILTSRTKYNEFEFDLFNMRRFSDCCPRMLIYCELYETRSRGKVLCASSCKYKVKISVKKMSLTRILIKEPLTKFTYECRCVYQRCPCNIQGYICKYRHWQQWNTEDISLWVLLQKKTVINSKDNSRNELVT